jgi:tRNA(Arg) A34 adenosine deaminase TadA
MSPESLMQVAVETAVNNVRSGSGGPFGAVVARGGEVVASGGNRVTTANDPTAHAEIVAIREACRKLATFDLSGCEIYSSCEPCPMCLSAIYWARLDRVYYSASSADAAAAQFDDGLIYEELARPADQRRIAMVQLARELADRPFAEWQRKLDRVPY